ncbi:MAG: glycosyltransferase family 2 protein [Chloroflexi bacterium]|nr:glycosyltransferase family 2 protein [Chloroflexota bacterium]
MSHLITYVVIVNWNGKEILKKCLTSFFANTSSPDCRVVVVDNASTDGSAEMVQTKFPQVKLIRNSENAGFSKANNQGIRHALENGAVHILLLNNDVEITSPGWLDELSSVLESDSKIGIVGCKLLYPDGTLQHAGGIINLRVPHHRGEGEKDTGQYDKVELVDYVTGAALMIKSDVVGKIGLLDEGFTPLYFEDTDWCVRARLYGYKVAYTPSPTLIHHCGSSSNKLGSEKKRFYSRRSFIRFTLLNYQTTDIAKRILLFESKEVIRCFVVRPQHGKLPIALRPDTYSKLLFFAQVWWASIRDLKGIMSLRRQRFVFGAKLHLQPKLLYGK